jgi:hypothetical protein
VAPNGGCVAIWITGSASYFGRLDNMPLQRNHSLQQAVIERMTGVRFHMFDPRQELATAEFRRYSAECRRLAALARPRAKSVGRKPKPVRRSDWVDSIVRRLREPAKRERKLITAHR